MSAADGSRGSGGRRRRVAPSAHAFPWLDARPIVVAVAGPNGAGKSTFYHAHIEPAGLRFVNADLVAAELRLDSYRAARVAQAIRERLVAERESFAFETVFSDPVRDKLDFLKRTASSGYTVVLCFIGLSSADVSAERVAMRVSQGGHDVPSGKLLARFPRTLANLAHATTLLPHVLVFDNTHLVRPFRLIAEFEDGRRVHLAKPAPEWLRTALAR